MLLIISDLPGIKTGRDIEMTAHISCRNHNL